MILRPSNAHRWMSCAMSAHAQATRPVQPTDAAREGTCAAWVAELLYAGTHRPDDLVGTFHENGWEVDREMVDHIAEYVTVLKRYEHAQTEVFMQHGSGLQGTADCIGWTSTDLLYVTDLKYGYYCACKYEKYDYVYHEDTKECKRVDDGKIA